MTPRALIVQVIRDAATLGPIVADGDIFEGCSENGYDDLTDSEFYAACTVAIARGYISPMAGHANAFTSNMCEF